jgi:hypothetical protein
MTKTQHSEISFTCRSGPRCCPTPRSATLHAGPDPAAGGASHDIAIQLELPLRGPAAGARPMPASRDPRLQSRRRGAGAPDASTPSPLSRRPPRILRVTPWILIGKEY